MAKAMPENMTMAPIAKLIAVVAWKNRKYPRATRPYSAPIRSEEHTSELQSLMRISYAVFCLKKKKQTLTQLNTPRLKPQKYQTTKLIHKSHHSNTTTSITITQ